MNKVLECCSVLVIAIATGACIGFFQGILLNGSSEVVASDIIFGILSMSLLGLTIYYGLLRHGMTRRIAAKLILFCVIGSITIALAFNDDSIVVPPIVLFTGASFVYTKKERSIAVPLRSTLFRKRALTGSAAEPSDHRTET